eukprot:28920_1
MSECKHNHHNLKGWIPPSVDKTDLSIQHKVIVSDICASGSHLIVNDQTRLPYANLKKNAQKPYIKLSEHISEKFEAAIEPEILRNAIHYISNDESIKSFWSKLSEFSNILHNKSTPFLCPPITECQEPSCKSKLCVADIRVHKCITSKNESDTTVAEVSLRCRTRGCKRFEHTLYYNYETFGKDREPKYWAGNMAGPYRRELPIKRVHTKQVAYLPMYFRWGHIFYSQKYLFHVDIDTVQSVLSFSKQSKAARLKTMVNDIIDCPESKCEYGHNHKRYSYFNSAHLLNAWITWRCVWVCVHNNVFMYIICTVFEFEYQSIIMFLYMYSSIHYMLDNQFVFKLISLIINLGHMTDIYGCYGEHNNTASPQFGTDALRLLTWYVLYCLNIINKTCIVLVSVECVQHLNIIDPKRNVGINHQVKVDEDIAMIVLNMNQCAMHITPINQRKHVYFVLNMLLVLVAQNVRNLMMNVVNVLIRWINIFIVINMMNMIKIVRNVLKHRCMLTDFFFVMIIVILRKRPERN